MQDAPVGILVEGGVFPVEAVHVLYEHLEGFDAVHGRAEDYGAGGGFGEGGDGEEGCEVGGGLREEGFMDVEGFGRGGCADCYPEGGGVETAGGVSNRSELRMGMGG